MMGSDDGRIDVADENIARVAEINKLQEKEKSREQKITETQIEEESDDDSHIPGFN